MPSPAATESWPRWPRCDQAPSRRCPSEHALIPLLARATTSTADPQGRRIRDRTSSRRPHPVPGRWRGPRQHVVDLISLRRDLDPPRGPPCLLGCCPSFGRLPERQPEAAGARLASRMGTRTRDRRPLLETRGRRAPSACPRPRSLGAREALDSAGDHLGSLCGLGTTLSPPR